MSGTSTSIPSPDSIEAQQAKRAETVRAYGYDGKKCEDLVVQYQQCFRKGFFHRVMGRCELDKLRMDRCLENEFNEMRRNHTRVQELKEIRYQETLKKLGY